MYENETQKERLARIAAYIKHIEKYKTELEGSHDPVDIARVRNTLGTLRQQYGHMVPKSIWN